MSNHPLLSLPVFVAFLVTGAPATAAEVTGLARLEDGMPSACGFVIAFGSGGDETTASLFLARRSDGLHTVLRVETATPTPMSPADTAPEAVSSAPQDLDVERKLPKPGSDGSAPEPDGSAPALAAPLPQRAPLAADLTVADVSTAGWPVVDRTPDRYEASTVLPPDTGARLFQGLAVGGGRLGLDTGTERRSYRIPGPFPQSARALFLNCSGDLFRQER